MEGGWGPVIPALQCVGAEGQGLVYVRGVVRCIWVPQTCTANAQNSHLDTSNLHNVSGLCTQASSCMWGSRLHMGTPNLHSNNVQNIHLHVTVIPNPHSNNVQNSHLDVTPNLHSKCTKQSPGCNPKPAQQMYKTCLLYTSPSPRDRHRSRMPSSA